MNIHTGKRKILIVEDEAAIAMDLKMRLTKMGYQVTGIAMSYDEVLEELKQDLPELVLVDIRLEGEKSGIDVALYISDVHHLPIIFLTAFGDRETFRSASISRPAGFLTKPYKDADLQNTIELAFTNHHIQKVSADPEPAINEGNLFIKDGFRLLRIRIDQIVWIQALDNYSEIHTSDGKKQLVTSYLGVLEKKLPSASFIRIHRSYVVALDKITKIEDDYVHLDQKYLPISKSYKQTLIEKLNVI